MKKRYTFEFLFDNGITERFITNEGTQEEIESLVEYLTDSIKGEAKGIFAMEDLNGKDANINIAKITRFTVID